MAMERRFEIGLIPLDFDLHDQSVDKQKALMDDNKPSPRPPTYLPTYFDLHDQSDDKQKALLDDRNSSLREEIGW